MKTVQILLQPSSTMLEVPQGTPLAQILTQYGLELPCGGMSQCGGCGVRVLGGSLSVTENDRTVFSAQELSDGWRLACNAFAEMPLVLECGQWHMNVLTDNTGLTGSEKSGLGIAIDLGTTTIAAQLLDLATGDVLGVQTELNPQAVFGSDIMSRVKAALSGTDLTIVVRHALQDMIAKLARGREEEIAEVVLVGNTVMHHLFSGLDIEPLSHAPFHSSHLGTQSFAPADLGWPLPPSCRIRMEQCLGGFVGSDIFAGIIAVGMHESEELVALVDLGTNGEIALGNRHGIVCASTAAGPAFEAGCIRMGMRAATGAISHVSLVDGELYATVIGNGEARGICGSGLVDAVAMGLNSGRILPSGRIADRSKSLTIHEPVVLHQSDIRELQLAKGAIASGFNLLLERIGKTAEDLHCVYLAGAFGNYVQIESAIRIGLLQVPIECIHASGNTALRGAKMLLLSNREVSLPAIDHVELAALPNFQDEFMISINFSKNEDITVVV